MSHKLQNIMTLSKKDAMEIVTENRRHYLIPTSRRCAIKRATISYAIDSDF